ncbi:MAG: hypothetical protein JW384_00076 [Nitrosomonadaceae bacterium]|nr:hypothetical protein [Nitrosomonadaceae bacterium]
MSVGEIHDQVILQVVRGLAANQLTTVIRICNPPKYLGQLTVISDKVSFEHACIYQLRSSSAVEFFE